jgi:hypothetical protein
MEEKKTILDPANIRKMFAKEKERKRKQPNHN